MSLFIKISIIAAFFNVLPSEAEEKDMPFFTRKGRGAREKEKHSMTRAAGLVLHANRLSIIVLCTVLSGAAASAQAAAAAQPAEKLPA